MVMKTPRIALQLLIVDYCTFTRDANQKVLQLKTYKALKIWSQIKHS